MFETSLAERFKVEQGHLVRVQQQPGRDKIMDATNELRKNEGALKPLGWGALSLRIPDIDYVKLVKKYPDLMSPNNEQKRAAWLRFMGSSEADPYRVTDRKRAPRITR